MPRANGDKRSAPGEAPAEGTRNRLRLKIGSAGRVLLPANIRAAMQLEKGSAVLVWLERGELHLVGCKSAAAQAQRLARELIAGSDSLADQQIADRREEAVAQTFRRFDAWGDSAARAAPPPVSKARLRHEEGGGPCVRDLDRPSPTGPRTQRPI